MEFGIAQTIPERIFSTFGGIKIIKDKGTIVLAVMGWDLSNRIWPTEGKFSGWIGGAK